MSCKWLSLWCIVLSVCFAGTLLAQDQQWPVKWNIDPRLTNVHDPNVVAPEQNRPLQESTFGRISIPRVYNTPMGTYTVDPNVRPLPRPQDFQTEVIITRHPTNQNIMFGSSNTFNASGTLFISEGVYVTTNAGASWFGSDTLNGAPLTNHGGDPGPVVDKDGRLIMTHLGFLTSGMYANYSTDNGTTWSNTFTIATGSQDKNLATTDDAPSSPYYGRSYVVWSLFNVANPPIAVSYTTNGGVSWSAPAAINTSVAGHYSQGCDIRVGPNGEVYVVWAAPGPSPSIVEDFAGFAKSTNGGVTWTVTNNAFDMNGLRTQTTPYFQPYGIRMNSFPRIDVDRSGGPTNGWIYIATSQVNLAPAGADADIIIHRSTDGGATWSAGIRVNQDPLNNGKLQFYNAVRVDENGGVNVVYYDNRNTSADSAEVMMSRSLDGGNTWTDMVVSDHRFKPKAVVRAGIAGGYAGDYIGITSGNGKAWPIWMDDATGVYQAWTTSIVTAQDFGWVKGTITNAIGGAQLPGVNVDFTESILQVGTISGATGFYKAGAKVDTPATTRNVTLRARKFGFRDTLIAVSIVRNDTVTRNFTMSPVSNPTITVSPTSLIFPTTILGTTRRDSSTARNVGLQTLNISSLTTTNARFAATATSLSLAYGDSARIRVVYTPLLSGVDTGRVIILSNDPNSPRVDITLTASAGNHDIGVLSLGGGLSAEGPAMSGISKQMAAATEKQAAGESDLAPDVNKGKNNSGITISSSFGAPTDVSGDALLNFRALVRNYGAFVETTYQVGWIIDGVAQTPLSNTRPLQISATDTLVLTWSNPTEGSHVARAWALLTTDINHSNDTSAPYNFNVLPPGVIFQEGFNATIPPYPAGWHVKNVDGGGTRTWFQGNPTVFPPFEGTGYIGANYQAANGFFIDEWLVTPNTGGLADAAIVDSLIFWQRAPGLPGFFPDSIQIRISTTDTAVASFTTVLDYFRVDTSFWRRKAYALPNAANRYIAFRYLIYDGGASGDNSNYLGLDAVQIQRTFAATPGWVTQPSGLTTALYSVKAVDPNTGWIGGAGGRVLRTTTSGDTWTSVGGGAIGTADVYAVEALDANTAFVTTSPGGGGAGTFIYRTINGGASWTQVYTDPSAAAFIDAMKMYDANNGIALGDPVGGKWVILRTTNGGVTWVRDTANAPLQVGTEAGSNNGMTTLGTTHVWFTPNGTANRVYRTTNGGTSWTSSILPFTSFTAGIAFCNTQFGVAGGNGGLAARTTDGGATWTSVTIPGSGAIYGISASGSRDMFAARGTNVYRSTDLGATWTLSLTGTIGSTLWYCSFATSGSNTRGWVTSGTGGIAAFFGSITGVKENTIGFPTSFALMQNYPNPFNPTTRIEFALPEESIVRLRVYNILGQEVATLANEQRPAGYFVAEWNATNNSGNKLSSGVYFYRMDATSVSGENSFTSLKKMLILK